MVPGENSEVVGEVRDRADLNLDDSQIRLLQALAATGKPIVLVLLNGRPLTIRRAAEHLPAIVEDWFPGESGGTAVADVLFGDVNPSGKLSISFAKSVGQLPVYYNRKPSANRSYVDMDSQPLFPSGHGLSSTQFDYRALSIAPADSLQVQLDVQNTGNLPGTEVVQFYIQDVLSSITTPIMALKGF